ncbi:YihY/virulence factor BrkB family protein [Oscillospiraceae bacterium OttesenSCG-928-G22]|nr:YihY/virulence factor BrkB family protein [Oscillospiraceae bacterium OttesenSCG-928-G22]
MGTNRRRVSRGKKWIEKNRERASGLYETLMKNRAFSAASRFLAHIFEDDIFGIAAQTSFFLFISIFPFFLVILSSLARLEMNLDFEYLEYLLPSSVVSLLSTIFTNTPPTSNMTFISLIFAVFSASTAIWALMVGISRSFTGEVLNRPIWQRVVAFVFMVGFIIAVILSLVLWFYGNYLLNLFGESFGEVNVTILSLGRHAVLLLWLFLFILALYRYTPGVRSVKTRNMLPGALFAAVGWNIASWGFEVYMRLFSTYSALYGQMGAVLGLALWLFIITIVLLLGAEVNAFLYKETST